MQSAAKVGLMVLILIGMLIGVAATLNISFFQEEKSEYRVVFADAGGLTAGSAVSMSGVMIGTVSSVELESPTRAVARIRVSKDQRIPEGSRVVMNTSFLALGTQEIQVLPGEGPGNLGDGAEIPGSVLGPLESLIPQSEQTLEQINRTLAALSEVLEDEELKTGMKAVMASAQQTTDSVTQLTGTMNRMMVRNQEEFDGLIASTAATMANMEEVSLHIKEIVAEGVFEEKALVLMDSLTEAVDEGRLLVKEFREFAGDEELQASIKSSVSNVEKITESGVEITGDLKEISDSGTRVAKDFEEVSANGIAISEETLILMKKANELADEVSELIEGFKGTVEKLKPSSGLFPEIKSDFSIASINSEGDGNHIRTNAFFTTQAGDDEMVFGLYDAFETNRITAQLRTWSSNQLGLRYGVYAGRPGVGVDYRVAPTLQLRGDLFGLNDPRFDFRLQHQFGRGVYGWAGLDRIFEQNSFSVGLGMKR